MQIIKKILTKEENGIPLIVEEYKKSKTKFLNGPGFSRIYFEPETEIVKLLSNKEKSEKEKIEETYKKITAVILIREVVKKFNRKRYDGAKTINNIDFYILDLINNIATKSIVKNLTVNSLLESCELFPYKIKSNLEKSKAYDIIDSIENEKVMEYFYSSIEYKSLKEHIKGHKTKIKGRKNKYMHFILDMTKEKTN